MIRRLCHLTIGVVGAALVWTGAALAQDGPWTVVSADGVVSAAVSANAVLQPVRAGDTVSATALIVTGTNGRALLDRDGDRIQITPSARMELAPTATSTTVLQRAGRAVYDIVTGGRPRFKVETPYLVAGVKGTVFSVTVTTTGASVSVSEGVVSVDPPTPSGFSAADVGAGQSAAVAVEAGSLSITVGDTPAGDVPAPLHDDSTRSAAPERGNSTATSARGTGRGNANGRGNSQGRGQAAAQFDGDVVSIDTSSAGGGGGGGGGGGDGGNAGGNSGGGGNA